VLSPAGASSHLVRRQVGPAPAWMAVAIAGAITYFSLHTKTVEGKPAQWPFILSLAMFLPAIYLALRIQFGRVKLTVEDLVLSVTETLGLRLRPLRIERARINGLWVRVEMGDDGPSGFYSLMLDQDAAKSVRLVGAVSKLRQLLFLCEDIAGQLGVPSDTRAIDLV
jgi:hypothetical protein